MWAKYTILMFPHVDCFIGVKNKLSIQKSPDAPRGLFGLVGSCAFKLGDEVLQTMIVKYTNKL
jgi:hypothetical protein